jgi:hypothetical protein
MPHRLVVAGLFVFGIGLSPASTAAQGSLPAVALPASAEAVINAAGEPKPELKVGKVVRALRIRGLPPAIDGVLGDEVWTAAERATGFVQRDPDNGNPMTEETRIQVAYDDRYLYVAVACDDKEPVLVAAGLSRRDEMGATDFITVGFDARHDHQTAFAFQTNPSAVQVDMSYFNDESQDRDYNAVWDVRTSRTDRGWTAEYRIPFSQMRFTAAPEPGQVWGFGASRQIRRRGEFGAWVPRPRGERGEVSLWGHLVFDDPIAPPRRLELVPYVGARSEHVPNGPHDGGASMGLDVRAGLGTAATLAGTFNPDFGQVEQDPAVLNLSVFETFFPEKRQFFLEDSRTFLPPYGNFQLFHSRRIGRAPGRLALAEGERILSRPDETTILGATKLTGKGAGWTYGAMTALTAREYAQVESPIVQPGGAIEYVHRERLIEPATSYNVMRIQRDVLNGSSNIGGLVTGVFRDQSDDAFTGGFDYSLRWDRNRTNFNGHWAATRAPGTGGMKTSGGGVTNFNVSRKYLNLFSHYDRFGKDFRVNDLGFLRVRQNRNQANAGLEAFNPDPGNRFRRFGGGVSLSQGWTDERLVWQSYGEFWGFVQFLNFWQTSGGMFGEHEVLDDLDTRGGPPIVKPSYSGVFFNLNSDQRKSWRWNVYANHGTRSGGGNFSTVNTGLTLQLSDRVQTSFSTNYNFGHDLAQWITNVDGDGDGTIDHVYGTLDRDVVDVTLRGTYAFSRDLTLQAYLQPFVAVGDYADIRKLARPRSFEFDPITLPYNPDFNTKSLRGNIVMRWEYKPGSTLFFVWDLSQADRSRPGQFSPLRDLRTAFAADATHIFMVKASYWLNR